MLGNSPSLPDDAAAALRLIGKRRHDACAVNGAGARWPGHIRFWASYHPAHLVKHQRWAEKRERMGGNMNFWLMTNKTPDYDPTRIGVGRFVFAPPVSGSSTLLAVLAGLALGYKSIWVAGAPLDHPGYQVFRQGWIESAETLATRVRSMSGWTKTFLEAIGCCPSLK